MSGDDGEIRAFLAIELDPAARRAAAGVVRALRERAGGDDVRWVRPEALHVTLRFLGEVARARLPALAARAGEAAAAHAPFALALGAVRPFPTPRRPRVLALALAPEAPLVALAAALEAAAVACGFPPEARRFRPHLTLGRARGRELALGPGGADPPGTRFDVREVVLFRSELHPSGARYTALWRLALGAGANGSPPRVRDPLTT